MPSRRPLFAISRSEIQHFNEPCRLRSQCREEERISWDKIQLGWFLVMRFALVLLESRRAIFGTALPRLSASLLAACPALVGTTQHFTFDALRGLQHQIKLHVYLQPSKIN